MKATNTELRKTIQTIFCCSLLVGSVSCGSNSESIDRRPGSIVETNPGTPLTPPDSDPIFETGHPESLIGCLNDGNQATSCRLLDEKTVLAEGDDTSKSYQISYQFNCTTGSFGSGLFVKFDQDASYYELLTDSSETFTLSGKGDLLIMEDEKADFASEFFNTGCHLLLDVEALD